MQPQFCTPEEGHEKGGVENSPLAEVSFPRVDQAGCARVLANCYSVPRKRGLIVEARAYSSLIDFHHEGERIAVELYGRAEQVLDLEHYLDVLDLRLLPWNVASQLPISLGRSQCPARSKWTFNNRSFTPFSRRRPPDAYTRVFTAELKASLVFAQQAAVR